MRMRFLLLLALAIQGRSDEQGHTQQIAERFQKGPLFSQRLTDSAAIAPHLVAHLPNPIAQEEKGSSGGADPQKLETSVTYLSGQVDDVATIIETAHPNAQIVVSTDSEEIARKAVSAASDSHSQKFKFLFFGDLVSKKTQTLAGSLKKVAKYTGDSIVRDPVGFVVTTFVTARDHIIWLHAESHSVTQKTFMLIFNTFVYTAFGINKDNWAKTIKPLENSIFSRISVLGSLGQGKNPAEVKRLVSSFFANAALSVVLTTVRMGILSIDQLVQSLGSPDFWRDSLMIGTALAATQFAFSEQLYKVDENTSPVAKFSLRRFTELRAAILGWYAPSAYLLQTGTFGPGPWFVVLGHGLLGLIFYWNTPRIVDWLERRKTLLHAKTKFDFGMERLKQVYLSRLRKNPVKKCEAAGS